MTTDLESNLNNYKVQLSQVEAALTADPENEELNKLKVDLVEVIQLTKDLVGVEESKSEAMAQLNASANRHKEKEAPPKPVHDWKVGDNCFAIWSRDGKYHRGVIEEIIPESSTVAVSFAEFDQADVCQLTKLKLITEGEFPTTSKSKSSSKKELMMKQREIRKKKNQKKKIRAKEKEAESEISKHKWKEFNKKVSHKSMKGQVKRSIFASPEGVGGRVGVGTCGTADKDMTKYEGGAKYNARHLVPR